MSARPKPVGRVPPHGVDGGAKNAASGKAAYNATRPTDVGRVPSHGASPEGAKGLRGLPGGWRWAEMSEVCSRVQDGTHFSPKEQTRTGDNGPADGNDQPQSRLSLIVGSDGAAYVTGASDGDFSIGTTSDFVTVKYLSVQPPEIAVQAVGSNLGLSWPSGPLAWRLQKQTNPIVFGIGTNWMTVNGSEATNWMSFPVSTESISTFFRLVYP